MAVLKIPIAVANYKCGVVGADPNLQVVSSQVILISHNPR